jgi:hypothetical protein
MMSETDGNRTMQTTLDGLKREELQNHLGIGKSQFYNRIKLLAEEKGILITQNDRGFYDTDQIAVLEALNDHLKRAGATIANFPIPSAYPQMDIRSDSPIGIPIGLQAETMAIASTGSAPSLIELVQAIAASVSPAPAADPLARYRDLQEAADNRWWLSSSRVEALIGVAPADRGDSFDRCGFNFKRVGLDGNEITWLVSKKSICV